MPEKQIDVTQDPELPAYLEYLDWLRGEGPVNMFGAAPYLTRQFGLIEEAAEAVLAHWMNTFSTRHAGDEAL